MRAEVAAAGIHPVRVMSASAHAVVELVMAFRLEKILPGEQLPTIPVLAERLGVSPAVAQSAVATLAEFGVLDVRRGRNGGIWLQNLACISDALCKVLPARRADRASVADLLDVRRVLQTEAAIRTAARADDAVKAQLLSYVSRMEQTLDRADNFLKEGAQLNCAIALHSGNSALADNLIRMIDEVAVAGVGVKGKLDRKSKFAVALIENQRELVDAIVANAPERIRAAVSEQMRLSLVLLN